MMNYYEIGQRIRRYRREKGMSQEQLAERVNISVTHMSHIETGNTKLSLPVLVDVADVLQVGADDLLTDRVQTADSEYILKLVSGCTPQQMDFICELIKMVKNKFPV